MMARMPNPGALTMAVAATVYAAGAFADVVPECSGSLQFDLPGAATIAASPSNDWRNRLVGGRTRQFQFAEGDEAFYAWAVYGGWVRITAPLKPRASTAILEEVRRSRVELKKNPSFSDRSIAPKVGVAWEIDGVGVATLLLGDSVFDWSAESDKSSGVDVDDELATIGADLAPRRFGNVPEHGRLCFPYASISSNRKTPYLVRTAYRLKDHPDVTILVGDESEAVGDKDTHSPDSSPRYRIDDFWTQYSKVKSVWADGYRPVTVAGDAGLQTFVSIQRPGADDDFGYLAMVSPRPQHGSGFGFGFGSGSGSGSGSGDRMVYVIRDARQAKAVGLAPVTPEHLLEISQDLTRSLHAMPR